MAVEGSRWKRRNPEKRRRGKKKKEKERKRKGFK